MKSIQRANPNPSKHEAQKNTPIYGKVILHFPESSFTKLAADTSCAKKQKFFLPAEEDGGMEEG